MEKKDSKLNCDNKVLREDFNGNTVQTLSNNQMNIDSREVVSSLFENILEIICMPLEKYKQIKLGLTVKQIDNFQKILERAKNIKDILGINVFQPPLKFSIPFIKQATCEHEEKMYDIWANLLIEAATSYNPIQLQYVDILSKIGNNEANLLHKIYQKQKQQGGSLLETKYMQSQAKDVFKGYNLLSSRVKKGTLYLDEVIPANFEFLFPYYVETSTKLNISDCLQQDVIQKSFETKIITSVNLLVQLNLIQKKYTLSYDKSGCQYAIPKIGLLLTEFGFSMIDCLENRYVKENK